MSTTSVAEFDIKDIGLAAEGKKRIEWSEREISRVIATHKS